MVIRTHLGSKIGLMVIRTHLGSKISLMVILTQFGLQLQQPLHSPVASRLPWELTAHLTAHSLQ
jgi:hypothetical protein